MNISKNKVVVGLIRSKTNSTLENIEIPQEVFEGVDWNHQGQYGDYVTMGQVIDDWLLEGFQGFTIYKMQFIPKI